MSRNIASHHQWAFRLYLVSNAQWFFRVGAFAYIAASSVLGRKPDFEGPFINFWNWGCFLVPLVVLQAYFLTRTHKNDFGYYAFAGALLLLTLMMCVGMALFIYVSQQIITGAPLEM
jgi:hypothetical protein